MSWTAVAVACALMHAPQTHISNETALIEAQAFVDNASGPITLETLLGVAWVESRLNPMGSQTDRNVGVWGIFQLLRPELRCLGPGTRIRVRGRHHHSHWVHVHGPDNPLLCTAEQTRLRAEYFDPATNIRRGALLLARRYQQVHAGRYSARVYAAWVGAFWNGSVPPHRRRLRQFFRYASRVSGAIGMMRRGLEQCREDRVTSGVTSGETNR